MTPRKRDALRRLVNGGVILQQDHCSGDRGTSYIWCGQDVPLEHLHGATFHAIYREGWIEETSKSNILHRSYQISPSGRAAAVCWAIFRTRKVEDAHP